MLTRQSRLFLSFAFLAAALGVVGFGLTRVAHGADGKAEFSDDYFFNPSDDSDQKSLNELVGKKMPELSVSDWSNGEVKPQDMKGKVVLVDIWATWCGPCVASIPHNNELYEKYKDKGLVIVGVCSSSRGQDKLGERIAESKIVYPVCKDPDLKTEKAYHLAFYPTYVAVDRKGVVRAIGLRPDKVEDVLKKLLDEKAQ